jgi:hypothetical protein
VRSGRSQTVRDQRGPISLWHSQRERRNAPSARGRARATGNLLTHSYTDTAWFRRAALACAAMCHAKRIRFWRRRQIPNHRQHLFLLWATRRAVPNVVRRIRNHQMSVSPPPEWSDGTIRNPRTGNVTVFRKNNRPVLGPLGDSLDDFK